MKTLSFLSACVLLLAAAGTARAHSVRVWAAVEGDSVRVRGFFRGGGSAQGAQIIVTDPGGTTVAEGVTNAEGLFFFKPARKTDLLIKIDAGMGHCAEYTLGADELEGLDMAATPVEGAEANQTPSASKESVAILKKMNARLASMEKKLNELLQPDEGAHWRDIIAGIGYILGLTGITMYFMGRARRRGQ